MSEYPLPPDWKDTELVRYSDGMLSDLFVEHWAPEDWGTFLDFVAEGPWRFEFSINGDPAMLIRSFKWEDGVNPLLEIKVGRMKIDCHFFGDNEFELTLDQTEIACEAAIECFSSSWPRWRQSWN